MQTNLALDQLWLRASERVTETMGLHFPPVRIADLQKGLARAAEELGFRDAVACADWLISTTLTKAQIDVLASQLTIGETYFFREKKMFDALSESILPELIRKRRGGERRLRIWSAACCTGEEPYSLAILLSQCIPELADWHVRILATDINQHFLAKAAAGIYGEWSFREPPPGFKERYFQRTPDKRYAILPEVKRRVAFAHLNLVEDVFPSLDTDTNAMDLIFCRNVLMYFAPPQARKVAGNLRRSLVDDGWLGVSASEGSQVLFGEFESREFPGTLLYRKSDAKGWPKPSRNANPVLAPQPIVSVSGSSAPHLPSNVAARESSALAQPSLAARSAQLYSEGRYAEASDLLGASSASPAGFEQYSLLARSLANQGRLGDALACCDRWLVADKLDAAAHYLRATILQELGEHEQARGALQRAIYLRPDLILAHFSLGNLARSQRRGDEAEKHFRNTLQMLGGQPPDEPLPESDGLTASRLSEIVHSFLTIATAP